MLGVCARGAAWSVGGAGGLVGSADEAAGVMVWGFVILVTNSSAMSWPRERQSPVAVAVVAYRVRTPKNSVDWKAGKNESGSWN